MQQRRLIAVIAVAIGLALALAVGWTARGTLGQAEAAPTAPAADTPPDVAAGASAQDQQSGMLAQRTKGNADAPITIYEASDFQCPYCRDFWEQTLPALEREYIQTGKARLIFLNLPLPQLHANAPAAHEFAMCGARQERFWPVHDLLFRYQNQWARLDDPAPYFMELADSAGLNADELTTCFTTGAVRGLVQQEAEMNFRAGIRSTPSFIVEDLLLPGFAPVEQWRPILDSIFVAKTQGG